MVDGDESEAAHWCRWQVSPAGDSDASQPARSGLLQQSRDVALGLLAGAAQAQVGGESRGDRRSQRAPGAAPAVVHSRGARQALHRVRAPSPAGRPPAARCACPPLSSTARRPARASARACCQQFCLGRARAATRATPPPPECWGSGASRAATARGAAVVAPPRRAAVPPEEDASTGSSTSGTRARGGRLASTAATLARVASMPILMAPTRRVSRARARSGRAPAAAAPRAPRAAR